MILRLAILATSWLTVVAAFAGEQVSFITRDGQSFESVTVSRVVGRRLEVTTPAGVRSLRYTNLPRAVQERFFDPSLLYPPQVGDALDFTTRDGVKYQGPLRAITPLGISIETAHGVDSIPFAKLPPELANTFDYDPEDAARYEAALRAQKAKALAAQQAAERKAAADKAARDRAELNARRKQPTPRESGMGTRGTKNLGAPQLGGSGLGK